MAEVAAIIAEHVSRWREEREGAVVIGLCGAQGSGKSTVAAAVARLLRSRGLRCVELALHDLYLTRVERMRLAKAVHPLLATRGPPGTHDVDIGLAILATLTAGGSARIPRFDKLSDDRETEAARKGEAGPFDVILMEGWCVGAAPQPEAMLAEPINALERDEDRDGVWRGHVNAMLSGAYQTLFARLDRLVMLQAPSFDVVLDWRLQQEAANAAAADPARQALAMDPTRAARFIRHYERITRWMLEEVATRADLVIALDEDRGVAGVRSR